MQTHEMEGTSRVTDAIRSLLGGTTLPRPVVDTVLVDASPLWLASAPATSLARDLALCHPPLGPTETRAVAHPLNHGLTRLTVAGHDRVGFLADSAGVLAEAGVSVHGASAITLPNGIGLHALTVGAGHLAPKQWDAIGERLREVGAGTARPQAQFLPVGTADVTCSAADGGRRLLTVSADDQVGLLSAICRWLADHSISVESAHITERRGRAHDEFVVRGYADIAGLRGVLSAPRRGQA